MDISRREFVRSLGAVAAAGALGGCAIEGGRSSETSGLSPEVVNDVHSQLNETTVAGILRPASESEVAEIVTRASRQGRPISICGGRHAGGGQQFLKDRVLVDLAGLKSAGRFDAVKGHVSLGAGAQWPFILESIERANRVNGSNWTINQKQGGSDWLSLGGAISANAHGRCLNSRPIVQDVESLRVVLPDGRAEVVSRKQNAELFKMIVGGYGMFGVVTEVTLRLAPRRKLRLRADVMPADAVIPTLAERQEAGATHGDWQFSIDPQSPRFIHEGILTSYAPVEDSEPITHASSAADAEVLTSLAVLAHVQPGRAFELFAEAWHKKAGQVDYSDRWQISTYTPGYHASVDARMKAGVAETEVLSEFYVPRMRLTEFLDRCGTWLRDSAAKLIYGVVRLVRADEETFLDWAREDQACVIFNLHANHNPAGVEAVRRQLHGVAGIAIDCGGRFYLTYGRFADREQLAAGYPQLAEFVRRKRRHDPGQVLQSEWYRWVSGMVG